MHGAARGLGLAGILALIFSLPAGAAVETSVRAGYHTQNFSYASAGTAADLMISQSAPRQWELRGGASTVQKFGASSASVQLGATRWTDPSTILSIDADIAPGQALLPRQSYALQGSRILSPSLVASLGYRLADYTVATAHTLSPSLDWTATPRWDGTLRYYLTFSAVGGQTTANHSALIRANFRPSPTLTFFAGYARGSESFESGNPVSPTAGFLADHLFGGLQWELIPRLRIDLSFENETRDNGQSINTVDAFITRRW